MATCEKCSAAIVQDSPYRSMEMNLPKQKKKKLFSQMQNKFWKVFVSVIGAPVIVGGGGWIFVYLPYYLGDLSQHLFKLSTPNDCVDYWCAGFFLTLIIVIITILTGGTLHWVGKTIYNKLNK